MDKAIDTLEFLREYLNNEVHPNCEYYIYSSLIDITDKALAELTAHKAKIDELKEWASKTTKFALVSDDFSAGYSQGKTDILQKLEEIEC